jgi:hypothetical protein
MSVNVAIRCDRTDLKLKGMHHFAKGRLVRQMPVCEIDGFDTTNVVYVSKSDKKFKGDLVCQIQSETRSSKDSFILIMWKFPMLDSPQSFISLIELNVTELNGTMQL